jgi:acetyl-CoA acetyltransferase family protein
MVKERFAVINGFRTPMGKMGGSLAKISADILGATIVREVYDRYQDFDDYISEVIIGNVSQPAHAANIARVIALRAGIEKKIPAYTVHRNCASGIEAVSSAICKIEAARAEVVLVAGVESMSNIPLLFSDAMKEFLEHVMRAKNFSAKLSALTKFRLKFLKPELAIKLGLTDPVCNLIMGMTAENLAMDFAITRNEQDEFALQSHQKAEQAIKNGVFQEEIIAIPTSGHKNNILEIDEGVRYGQNLDALAKLKPFFDRKNGTVTAGNSSQITDGAAAAIIMSESRAKKIKIPALGYVRDFVYNGLEPSHMGLGPAYAIANILKRNKLTLKDIDLFEINEAFAAQVIACVRALDSKKFCKSELGLSDKLGEIASDKLNVNGGAIALGHPVGMTGMRLVIHALRELSRKKKKRAIISLCIGGGQGGALLLEAN